MNRVFDLPDGRCLMLYAEGNRVMVLSTPLRRGNGPLVRHNDCLGGLFSAAFLGRIYYVYENFGHQIAFGCLDEPSAAIVLSPSAAFPVFTRPRLIELSGRLYLFYEALTETGGRELWMMEPWGNKAQCCLYRGSGSELQCQWYVHGERPLMEICEDGGRRTLLAWDENAGNYMPWDDSQGAGAQAIAASGERNGELGRERASELQERNGELEAELAASRERCSELEQELAASRERCGELEQEVALSRERCGELEEQLASAAQQYEELAKTARELQRIGKHWREKYMEEKGTSER